MCKYNYKLCQAAIQRIYPPGPASQPTGKAEPATAAKDGTVKIAAETVGKETNARETGIKITTRQSTRITDKLNGVARGYTYGCRLRVQKNLCVRRCLHTATVKLTYRFHFDVKHRGTRRWTYALIESTWPAHQFRATSGSPDCRSISTNVERLSQMAKVSSPSRRW